MNSKLKQLQIKRSKIKLQTSTIPSGVTASNSKYSVYSSNTSITDPNVLNGPTQSHNISIVNVDKTYNFTLINNWIGKIKPGDNIQLKRGMISDEYIVKNVRYDLTGDNTFLSVYYDNKSSLKNFLGTSGFNSVASDTYLSLDRSLEIPNTSNTLIDDFSMKIVNNVYEETYSINTYWKIAPSVSNIRLRWRSVPRSEPISTLSATVSTAGNYSKVPNIVLSSDFGYNAKIKPVFSLFGYSVVTGGTGYTSSNPVNFIGGGGTGASAFLMVSGSSIVGLTGFSSGYGYTSIPEITIGGSGSGGEIIINNILVNDTIITQHGGGYLEAPIASVDSTYNVTGFTESSINISVSLDISGKIDYIRILNGGYGYTGASVTISNGALGEAIIKDGVIDRIKMINFGSVTGSTAAISVIPYGTGGTGFSGIPNINIYSEWNYVNIDDISIGNKTIDKFEYNIPYEIEIMASEDLYFRGISYYERLLNFEYKK